MRSIKPGRGPSFMGGIMSIFVGLFGIVWTVVAAGTGVAFMPIFGIIFVIIAIVQAVYHFSNATKKNRYSTYDITDHNEEPDPLNDRFGTANARVSNTTTEKSNFCPYCGTKAEEDYAYCNNCGKKLP